MKPLFACCAGLFLMLGVGPIWAKTLKPQHAPERKAAPYGTATSRSGNINVPATDFSTVEPAGDDTGPRAPTGAMRPSISDSGQLGMGTGF